MQLNPLRPDEPGPLPAHRGKLTGRAKKNSGWHKASVVAQGIGGLAIFVSLAGLLIGARKFNDQQEENAAHPVNRQRQTTLDHRDRVEKKSRWDKASVIVQGIGGLA